MGWLVEDGFQASPSAHALRKERYGPGHALSAPYAPPGSSWGMRRTGERADIKHSVRTESALPSQSA